MFVTRAARSLASSKCSINSSENDGYLDKGNGVLRREVYLKRPPALAVRRPDLSESLDLSLTVILTYSLISNSTAQFLSRLKWT